MLAVSDDGVYWYTIAGVGFLCRLVHFGQQKLLHKTNREADPSSIKGPTTERQACSSRWIYLNSNYKQLQYERVGIWHHCGLWKLEVA